MPTHVFELTTKLGTGGAKIGPTVVVPFVLLHEFEIVIETVKNSLGQLEILYVCGIGKLLELAGDPALY